ncbi:hypothetical protein DWB78_12975 [Halopelagius longus]|uniref:Uncharacterized protein n=1 Tax=Halopelagius longus TaxID=1236180 RepID=A0A370IPG9_9EURY|nr:hypothetical protein DWB78_12975 [Halopelagius longus]
MSDRGESEDALAADPTVTAAPRPHLPEASAAGVVRCHPVAAVDGGRSDSIGVPRTSELDADVRRPVGGG